MAAADTGQLGTLKHLLFDHVEGLLTLLCTQDCKAHRTLYSTKNEN